MSPPGSSQGGRTQGVIENFLLALFAHPRRMEMGRRLLATSPKCTRMSGDGQTPACCRSPAESLQGFLGCRVKLHPHQDMGPPASSTIRLSEPCHSASPATAPDGDLRPRAHAVPSPWNVCLLHVPIHQALDLHSPGQMLPPPGSPPGPTSAARPPARCPSRALSLLLTSCLGVSASDLPPRRELPEVSGDCT